MPPARLTDRHPVADPARLVAELVPPPRFTDVRLQTYRPDPGVSSQGAAVAAVQAFVLTLAEPVAPVRRLRVRRAPPPPERRPGLYLDGGFGVGKTHLLASLWHEAPSPSVFATFVELTHLVGALGFATAVEELAHHRLVCIDEFELDDPGDTVLVSTLLTRLVDRGVRLAATSNTLPDRLGEDRFAADDFLREIQALAAQFDVVRIDGEDYRHRGLPQAPRPLDAEVVAGVAGQVEGATLDDFDGLLVHLASVHPSRYGAMVDGIPVVALQGLRPVSDQAVALRLVVLADRLYDRDVPVVASGAPVDAVFTPELLRGGYRKKYHRAISRLVALAHEGLALGDG